jgi:predicted trehalose synthase
MKPEDRKALDHFRKLATGDYPPFLAAHHLVRVLIPGVAKFVGIREVTEELAKALAEGLAGHVGYYWMCKEKEAVPGDDICTSCLARQDQFDAEIDEAEKEED